MERKYVLTVWSKKICQEGDSKHLCSFVTLEMESKVCCFVGYIISFFFLFFFVVHACFYSMNTVVCLYEHLMLLMYILPHISFPQIHPHVPLLSSSLVTRATCSTPWCPAWTLRVCMCDSLLLLPCLPRSATPACHAQWRQPFLGESACMVAPLNRPLLINMPDYCSTLAERHCVN